MQQILWLIYLGFINIVYIHTQILYECNFDHDLILHHCFTTPISVVSNVGYADILVPTAPLSDVTSSLKPTENGEVCQLPYRIDGYDWDMYFCNDDHCPTASNQNSRCKDGKFGYVQLFDTDIKSYELSTPTGRINGTNQQCLVYYYYMSIKGEKNITILKEEKHGPDEIIDLVSDSPYNGWIKRTVPFITKTPEYKIYFLVQKLTFPEIPYVGFDEISIRQGDCEDELVTDNITSISMQTEIFTKPITTVSIISSIVTSNEIIISTTTTPIVLETSDSPTTSSNSLTSHEPTINTTTQSDKSTLTTTIPSTSSEKMTITSTYNKILPYETSHIIILSTVIPIIWIVFIIVIIWIRKLGINSAYSSLSKSPSVSSQFLLLSHTDYEIDQMILSKLSKQLKTMDRSSPLFRRMVVAIMRHQMNKSKVANNERRKILSTPPSIPSPSPSANLLFNQIPASSMDLELPNNSQNSIPSSTFDLDVETIFDFERTTFGDCSFDIHDLPNLSCVLFY